MLITAGCRTTREIPDLPPEPERQELAAPEDIKDLARIINYYEHLVQEWEAWAGIVKQMLQE